MRTDAVETKNPKNILIVDDEEDVCHYLKALLTMKTSHKVDFTVDPGEALERIRSSRVHLVISDIRMPKMDGIELLREAKKIDPDIEVVMLTGQSTLESAIDSLQHRAYDYLEKPLSSSRLLHVVGNALARQELSNELSDMVAKVVRLNRALKSKAREHVQVQGPMERSLAARVVLQAVALELKRPLSILETALGALKPNPVPDDDAGSHWHDLEGVQSMLERITRDFRNPAGLPTVDPRPGDIAALVKALIDDISELYSTTPIEVELPTEPVEAHFDRVAVSDIVTALFEHALRAVQERGKIWIQGRVDGPFFVLTVLDEGRELTDAQFAQLFDPLQDLAGLGLVIARQVAVDHGGSLIVDRDVRKGTCVELRLPLAPPGQTPP